MGAGAVDAIERPAEVVGAFGTSPAQPTPLRPPGPLWQANFSGAESDGVKRALGLFGMRWNLLILRAACEDVCSFEQLHRIGVTRGVLAQRLGLLTEEGLIERRDNGNGRNRSGYASTGSARGLYPSILRLTTGASSPSGSPAQNGNGKRAPALRILEMRWNLLILLAVCNGVSRFEQLHRLGVPRKTVARRLPLLVDERLLTRHLYIESPPGYHYVPTPLARQLHPAIAELARWGVRRDWDTEGAALAASA